MVYNIIYVFHTIMVFVSQAGEASIETSLKTAPEPLPYQQHLGHKSGTNVYEK